MTAPELHRRLRTIRVLLSVAGQHADDREHLWCAQIALDHLLRDITWGGAS